MYNTTLNEEVSRVLSTHKHTLQTFQAINISHSQSLLSCFPLNMFLLRGPITLTNLFLLSSCTDIALHCPSYIVGHFISCFFMLPPFPVSSDWPAFRSLQRGIQCLVNILLVPFGGQLPIFLI